ncbi:MAG: HAD family hydrolase [Planctomycetota bacterium]|jgi:phosphoglycolate phosphatase
MKFKAVIFDLDGTLLDTLEDIADSVNAVLTGGGFPTHPVEAFKIFIGDGVENLVRRAFPPGHFEKEPVEGAVNAVREEYGRRWAEKTAPYPGVPALLDALEQGGIRKAILSNKPDDLTKKCTTHLLSTWRFDPVRGVVPDVPKKPDPAGVHLILRAWDLEPEACIYVGDTGTDMKTGKAAGLFTVGVLWGFRSREELEKNGADAVVEEPEGILDLL